MIQIIQKRPLCLFALGLVLLLFVVESCLPAPPDKAAQADTMSRQAATVTVSGRLARKETKSGSLIYYLKDIQFQNVPISRRKADSPMYCICYMSKQSDYFKIGSRLTLQGDFSAFDDAQNEGQFDVQSYYTDLGYVGRLYQAQVLRSDGGADDLAEGLYRWRTSTKEYLQRHMTAEDAGILTAMLLGEKGDMDADIKGLYQKSGIAHILAISGLHISLLGMGLYKLLRRSFVPPKICSACAAAVIFLYAVMVGWGSSVTRAVCMFVLLLLADILERSYDLLTGLAFAALVILIKNPHELTAAGFLLSFTAVLGIALLADVFSAPAQGEDSKKHIWRIVWGPLSTSLSVQLMTLPVMLWFYYTISPYAVLLNLLVVPLMSGVLLTAIAAVAVRIPLLLQLPAAFLHLIELSCKLFRNLPGWQLVVGRPKVWQIVLYYLMLFGLLTARFLCMHREKDKNKKSSWIKEKNRKRIGQIWWLWPLSMCAACLILLFPTRRMDALDMLSVGQGDCVVLRTQEGCCVLSDAGSSEKQIGRYRLLPYLKYNGIRHVNAVFLSHAHSDHYSAILELFESARDEGITVDALVLGSVAQGNERYRGIVGAALGCGCKVYYMRTGDTTAFGALQLSCVYEGGGQPVADENDESMVLYASLSGLTVLLTGDSTQESDGRVLEELKKRGITSVMCLKTAHHGARTATGEELLEYIAPQAALISCGKDNSYGHPHTQTLERLAAAGARIYVTKDLGQIRLRRTRTGWQVEHYPFSIR